MAKPKYIPVPVKSTHKQGITRDLKNIFLLVFLYLLQGVPLGLSFGSIPFLLKSKLSYADLALFSLSSYPYSLKLLWSPFVDSIYLKRIGRRKSWIVPIQAIIGISLLVLGGKMDEILNQEVIPVKMLTLIFTGMVFLCATQDIAVDGWALTLLEDENKTYASTAQTIGLNTGYFLSFTVFLALNSPEFSNKYLRTVPIEGHGVLGLGSYLQFWGFMFLLCNFWLIFFKKEHVSTDEVVDEIKTVYENIVKVILMPHMKNFIIMLLICKIGFIANESVTGLKLLEKGFSKEDLALSVLIDFPLQLIFGYYAAKWSSGPRPLRPWLYAFYGRLLFAVVGMVVVYYVPDKVTPGYFMIVMLSTVLSSFMSTIQFVGIGSFFTSISDPIIGGTYMTLLNTLSNLGGTWPRYFILTGVEYFTDAPCIASNSTNIIPNIKCSDDIGKNACASSSGVCHLKSDGYYIVNSICVLFGFITILFYIKPQIQELEQKPTRAWRLKKQS